MPRDRYFHQALGGSLNNEIKRARVLMVGAGGIGCELLKNLVLTGFAEIHIVDLDTIDLSNLNRQFLFRHEHIKRSKALVAKETAAPFNPNVKLTAHHGNIKDPQFGIEWFSEFRLVFNALDNLEARRHVNRMCLAADVPLIESGTTGFNGQVQVIKRGISECYDCNPKDTPKTFPVCTIRSTPSQPIHCIVWAKSYLFAEIFGISEDESPDLDTTEDSENAVEIEKLRAEAQALKRLRDSMGAEDFPRKIFEKVFVDDINRLRSMDDMWKSRRPPEPLNFEDLSEQALGVGPTIAEQDQSTWTAAENLAVFSTSIRRLSDRLEELRASAEGTNAPPVLTFDKDDKDILDFVASGANLRSIIFGIEPKSQFEIKQMAGNIIPAIATTNAMAAGLCVLQAFKVLREDYNKARMVFLVKSLDRVISSEALGKPRPDCVVCGVSRTRMEVDLQRATLSDFVEGVLRSKLAYGEELSVSNEVGVLYDPELDDNLSKKLSDLDIKHGSFLTVVDEEDENPRVNLVLWIYSTSFSEPSPPITIPEKFEIARKPVPHENETQQQNGHMNGLTNGFNLKRKRDAAEADLEAENVKKRGKVMEERPSSKGDVDGVVVIEDNNDGAIVIDDD